MNKIFVLIFTVIIIFGFSSCSQNDNSVNSDEPQKVSTGDELLHDNVKIGDRAYYPETAENESHGMDRSFENAPPFIPHTVKGMIDIRQGDNECLLCHMPKKAKAENATPIPKSHFIDYRPKPTLHGKQWLVDSKDNVVYQESNGDKLENSRFFCNQCHVPQSKATVFLKNNFKATFRNTSDKSRSNLDQNISEGVK